MNVGRRELGIGVTLAGIVLWTAALVFDASAVAIILAIAVFLVGGALMLAAERQHEPTDADRTDTR